MKYGIGIDTGGTFTDSVIVDFVTHRIISKAKALTTRQDLRIGILNSLSALDAGLFPEVKLVSLSTTLATNSVVEGKGQRVGLIMAVPDERTFRMPADIPAAEVAVIRGAYDRSGNQTVPLDIDSGRRAIQRMKGKVDAFAVSGYFSIYNAGHELELKDVDSRGMRLSCSLRARTYRRSRNGGTSSHGGAECKASSRYRRSARRGCAYFKEKKTLMLR